MVRTRTIPTWTEALTFPDKQVMHATGAGAMAQELVIACHSGVGHSALAQAKATYSTPRKRFVLAFGQAFVRVGALRGKLAEN